MAQMYETIVRKSKADKEKPASPSLFFAREKVCPAPSCQHHTINKAPQQGEKESKIS